MFIELQCMFNYSLFIQHLHIVQCCDVSTLSFNAFCPACPMWASKVALYIPQSALDRNIMSHFSYPIGINSVSWCESSSVGTLSSHLSVLCCQWEAQKAAPDFEKGRASRRREMEKRESFICLLGWWFSQMDEREEIWWKTRSQNVCSFLGEMCGVIRVVYYTVFDALD